MLITSRIYRLLADHAGTETTSAGIQTVSQSVSQVSVLSGVELSSTQRTEHMLLHASLADIDDTTSYSAVCWCMRRKL
jgi:hypothetical protein